MRKITLLFIFLVSINCFSQNKQILYNLTSVPQSLMTNPGSDVKYTWFVGIPFLSGVSANIGSSSFSAYDLFANNGVDFNTKLRNVIASTSRNDKIAINEQLEVISAGFKIGDWQSSGYYVSFGMYQEMDLLMYMPKDYAILALDGNRDHIGKVFEFGDLNAKGELLSVFHLGVHKNLNEKLVIGARGKIYSSIFNFESTNNSGYFYTIPATDAIYEQVVSSNVMVNTSGFTNYTDNYSGNTKSDIIKKAFLGGNLGLGLDLGFTYYPKKNIQFTASIIDFGFVRQTKETRSYVFRGYYEHKGLSPDFVIGGSENGILEDFTNAIPLDTLSFKYTTWRPLKFNSSFEYSFGDDRSADCNCTGNEITKKNAVGAQFFAMSAPRSPLMALTAYYRRRIFDSLEMKATYTLDSFSKKNFGLGVSTTLSKVNFYLLADNLLEYSDISKANSLSFQFGINIVIPDKNTPD